MKAEMKDGVMIVSLTGRIEADNVNDIESQLRECVGEYAGRLYLDAEELTYISSAGLRLFLKLQHEREDQLIFINLLPEVMDIFQVTGFDTIFQLRGKMKEVSLEGLEKIGRGATADVYRLDAERVIKVHNDRPINTMDFIEQERIVSREIFKHDIPTAIPFDIVKVGDHIGVIYEAVRAKMLYGFLMMNPERKDEIVEKETTLFRKIHHTEFEKGILPRTKDRILSTVEKIRHYFSEDVWQQFLDTVNAIPDRMTLVHGDFHAGNIMVDEDGELILVDVGDCTTGHPVLDVAATIQMPTLLKGIMDERDIMAELFDLKDLSEEQEKKTLAFYAWLEDFWKRTLKSYTGVTDEKEVCDLDYRIKTYAFLIYMYKLALLPRTSEEQTGKAVHLMMDQFLERTARIGSLSDWWKDW